MPRRRRRTMIPMAGSGYAPGSDSPIRRWWTTVSSSSPLITVPAAVVAVLLVVGLMITSMSEPRNPNSVPATSPVSTDEPEATAQRGSGELNRVLVESIVQVIIVGSNGECSVGSGSVIGDDRHVLTNHHVIATDDECPNGRISIRTVTTASGQARETFDAEVVTSNRQRDIAILSLRPVTANPPKLTPLTPVDSDVVGQEMTVVGYPAIGGNSPTVSRGVLSGFTFSNGVNWIKTDALISGGNSGGAALDSQGRLLGVPTMYSESDSGEIVDCRNAADTNGDGQVDRRDQCVTTGGTLGLVAPLAAWESIARSAGLKIGAGE